MKPLTLTTVYTALAILIGLTACSKDETNDSNAVTQNEPPIARAGADQTVMLSQCHGNTGITVLDGTNSSDPQGALKAYSWKKIGGPQGAQLKDANALKTELTHLSMGEYEYELTVVDEKGLASKDFIKILVRGAPKEYDLDITFNVFYSFIDNWIPDPWGYGNTGGPADMIEYEGEGAFQAVGDFKIYGTEFSDSINTSNVVHSNYMQLSAHGDKVYLNGTISTNIKRVLIQGGGVFTGIYNITHGSAQVCDPSILTNQAPLSLSGTIDPISNTMRMRIQGKVFF